MIRNLIPNKCALTLSCSPAGGVVVLLRDLFPILKEHFEEAA